MSLLCQPALGGTQSSSLGPTSLSPRHLGVAASPVWLAAQLPWPVRAALRRDPTSFFGECIHCHLKNKPRDQNKHPSPVLVTV